MNRFHSRQYREMIEGMMGVMPVVVVTGARQVGKTTWVRDLLDAGAGRKYYTLDDIGVLEMARKDPDALLAELPVTIDEVQRAPELLLAVKRKVDEMGGGRMAGGILLTGSANLALMEGVAESLAGRAVYMELPPFCNREWLGKGMEVLDVFFEDMVDLEVWAGMDEGVDWREVVLAGGYPVVLGMEGGVGREVWFEGYVQTYLERDLRELSKVESLVDFRRLMRLMAERVGRLVNQSNMARDLGMSQATVHRYMNLLEAGFIVKRLENYGGRGGIKAKKLMWVDSGVAAYLAGVKDAGGLEGRGDVGFWLEQGVFQVLQCWRAAGRGRGLYYWRGKAQEEVDFVLEERGRVVGVEVKRSSVVNPGDLRGLRAFQESVGAGARGVVLYGGDEVRFMGEGVWVVPVAVVLG